MRSAQTTSDPYPFDLSLLDSIYQGATEPRPWKTFIRQLRLTLAGCMASFRLYSYSNESSRLSIADNDDDIEIGHFHAEFLRHYQEADFLFAPPAPGEVVMFSDLMPRAELLRSDFYRTFLAPNNLGDALRFCISEPGGVQAWIDIGRAIDAPPFNETERELCRQLIPYLERALAIYSTLKRNEAEKQVYEALTEQLTVGIALLDDGARFVRINDMAEQLLAGHTTVRQQRLHFRDGELQKQFERVFATALAQRGKTGLPVGIEALRIPQRDGSYIGVLVKAIPETRWYTGTGYPAVVLCICDPTRHDDARQSFVSQLFGLTLSEAALAILLADGVTLTEAAALLKVTEHTTRTVSKRIFAKMGVNRQADLVRLILRSVALLK